VAKGGFEERGGRKRKVAGGEKEKNKKGGGGKKKEKFLPVRGKQKGKGKAPKKETEFLRTK